MACGIWALFWLQQLLKKFHSRVVQQDRICVCDKLRIRFNDVTL